MYPRGRSFLDARVANEEEGEDYGKCRRRRDSDEGEEDEEAEDEGEEVVMKKNRIAVQLLAF